METDLIDYKGPYWTRKKKRKLWAYLFILPQVIIFLVFTLYPVIMTHVYSLYNWPGFGPLDYFVGINNFREVINDRLFWESFRRSFVFMAGTVAIQVPFALLLAILLNNSKLRGQLLYRTLIFLPVVITSAVVGVIMTSVFATHNGLINRALQLVGLIKQPVDWLGKGRTAMLALIIVASWKWLGMKMVYWLAGLQSLPEELYEAARVDGAGRWQLFRHITIPLLIPVGIVILLFSMIDALRAFDLIFTMTEGGPGFSTETIELYIYRYAFTSSFSGGLPEMGFASAAAVFFGLVVILISAFFSWLSKRQSQMR